MMADVDFDSLAARALVPPSPLADATDYDSLAGSVIDMQRARDRLVASQNVLAAQGANADAEAKALAASRTLGIPQPAAMADPAQAAGAAQSQQNVAQLAQSPGLASFVADNPLAARLAQDDFDKLGLIDRLTTALKTGVSSAIDTNALGRAGNVKQLAGLVGAATPQTDQLVDTLEGRVAATPKLTGAMGTVQGFAGFLAGLIDNAVQGGSEGAISGAAAGALVGSAAGGVGAAPGAAVGFTIGTGFGFTADMARVAAGNAYLHLGTLRGSDGQPISEAGKQFGAIFTGAATYALGRYGTAVESKVFQDSAEKIAQDAITQAVQTPTFARALTQFAQSTAKGAAQGAGVMTAMEASSVIGEEIAKSMSAGHFDTDPHEIVDRLAEAAVNGALTLGALHTTSAGLGLYGDFRAASRAQGQMAAFQSLLDGAADSKLRQRDLQTFRDFMQSQTDGSPVESLYVPAAVVRELYQGARIDPSTIRPETDPLFGFVPDMAKQLEEAGDTGGDIVIPTADFVAHLADSNVATRLMPDIRVGPDAMSLNEAKAFGEEYAARVKGATEEASQATAEPDSGQQIAQTVRDQAVAAGRPDVEASRIGAVYAARYTARAERRGLGEDPLALYKSEGPTIQAEGAAPAGRTQSQAERGKIVFGEDGSKTIQTFAKADASTLIHESGHAWLEELMADGNRPDAPAQLRDDLNAVTKWLGSEDGKVTDPQHEQFARAVEAYFLEGKAPSAGLARVFSRFKQWLTKIYRTVAALDTPINDDIRQVFDRMLATDDELAEATKTVGLEPNFKDRQQAGMTAAEWDAYLRSIDKANTEAESTMLGKMMARVRAQRSAEYREERAGVAEDVAKDVDARQDIQALNLLRHGKLPDGTDLGERIRLSTESIRSVYGKDGLAALPKGITAKDGVEPDYVSEMLGFDSPDEMIRALQSLEGQQRELREKEGDKRSIRQYLIDTETDRRMAERRGELEDEASIKDEAMAALHSEGRAEQLAVELRYLRRSAARELTERGKVRKAGDEKTAAAEQALADEKMGHRWDEAEENTRQAALRESTSITKPMLEAIRAQADQILSGKTVEQIGRYSVYLRNERKAAGEVQKALAAKDVRAAAAAKQRQILWHVLYTRARAAALEIERGQSTFQRLTSKASFKAIAQEYTDQIHDLLRRFGYDTGRGEELERTKGSTLEEFVKRQYDEGIELAVDPSLFDAAGKPIEQMTLSEFRILHEAVDSMNELGRGEKLIEMDGVKRELDDVVAEVTAQIRSVGEWLKSDYYDARDAGALAALKDKLFGLSRGADASLTKPEALFDQIDRGDTFGIMNRAVFRRLKDAQGKEFRWQTDAARDIEAAVKAAGKGWKRDLRKLVPDDANLKNPETGRPIRLTRERMVSIALNWGNEDQRTKLATGYGWDQRAVKAFLDRNMTKADWDFVQSIWDLFESHRDDLDALQKRVTGVGLKLVQADRFTTQHGEYRGGYYPIVYDPAKSYEAEGQAEKAGVDAMLPTGYTRATTAKGHTVSRVQGVKRPIELSLDVVPWKIGQVLHDLAYREAIRDADRVLSHPRVKKALDDVFGSEYRKTLRPWLKDVANVRNIDDHAVAWMDKMIRSARTSVVMVGIGFRLTTMFKHGMSALSNSAKELGPKWLTAGTKEFYRPGKVKDNWAFITDKSAEMASRLHAYDTDTRAAFEKLISDTRYTAFQKGAQRFGHLGVSMLDLGSAAPTWLGAYRKALSEGLEDKDAVYAADKTVRNAHGAQNVTDLAQIQRAHGVADLVNMFYGFFNHIYNRQRTAFIQGAAGMRAARAGEWKQATKNFADVLATSFWYVAVPALVEAIVTSGGPNEQADEGWGAWAGKAILSEIPAGIPILRDIAKAAIEGRDYELSPIAKAVNTVVQAGRGAAKVAAGEEMPASLPKHAAEAAGYLTALPTAAPFAAGKFLWDYGSGEADPESLADWYRGLTTGKTHP